MCGIRSQVERSHIMLEREKFLQTFIEIKHVQVPK